MRNAGAGLPEPIGRVAAVSVYGDALLPDRLVLLMAARTRDRGALEGQDLGDACMVAATGLLRGDDASRARLRRLRGALRGDASKGAKALVLRLDETRVLAVVPDPLGISLEAEEVGFVVYAGAGAARLLEAPKAKAKARPARQRSESSVSRRYSEDAAEPAAPEPAPEPAAPEPAPEPPAPEPPAPEPLAEPKPRGPVVTMGSPAAPWLLWETFCHSGAGSRWRQGYIALWMPIDSS